MSSTRLPGKVLAVINERPMIYWQIIRIKKAKQVDEIIVATTTHQSDDVLVDFLHQNQILVERGSIENVLERFLQILKHAEDFENIVRLTADCPLVMPSVIDEMLTKFDGSNIDYLSNALVPTFPDGLDIEIVKRSAITRLGDYPLSTAEMEHVTLGLRNRTKDFVVENFSQEPDLSNLRWTVDYEEDLEFVRGVYAEFKGNEAVFGYQDLLNLLATKPELKSKISGNLRNVALKETNE